MVCFILKFWILQLEYQYNPESLLDILAKKVGLKNCNYTMFKSTSVCYHCLFKWFSAITIVVADNIKQEIILLFTVKWTIQRTQLIFVIFSLLKTILFIYILTFYFKWLNFQLIYEMHESDASFTRGKNSLDSSDIRNISAIICGTDIA